MIRIAHRGNYRGRDSERENTLDYLQQAIDAGFDVEVDVWYLEGRYYSGHDVVLQEIGVDFLSQPCVWTHAKNLPAYVNLYRNPDVHVFWHDRDDFTFTSKGIKWAYSGVITHDGIMVMPDYSLDLCYKIASGQLRPLGVCSDNFGLFEPNISI